MNFVTFPVATTNVFPMANSTSGGQLLTEFNLRSRESVATPQDIRYMVGQSYTHSIYDFYIGNPTDSLNDDIRSSTCIQISEGRAVVNGHFIESLAPVIIDLADANAQLKKEKRDYTLSGTLCIGLRAMYSTKQAMAGALMTENEDDYYEGIQVVVLPEKLFKLPIDCPDTPNEVTAHLLLGKCKYINNSVTGIEINTDKVTVLTADRISDVGSYLSGTYVNKTGLNPKHHYVYTTKPVKSEEASGKDTWCEADDALMIWDSDPQLVSGSHSEYSEATFRYNPVNYKTELVIPHKQIDGITNTAEEPQHFLDKVIQLPVASFSNLTGGVVDRNYTSNIHRISKNVDKFFLLPNGGMKLYIAELDDRGEQLPSLTIHNGWQPGDYVLVGEDHTLEEDTEELGSPSTMYVVMPGKITAIKKYVGADTDVTGYIRFNPATITSGSTWDSIVLSMIHDIDWRKEITRERIESDTTDWNQIVQDAISNLGFLTEVDWQNIIDDAINQAQNPDNIDWSKMVTDVWTSAYTNYIAKRQYRLDEIQDKRDKLVEDQQLIHSQYDTIHASLISAQRTLGTLATAKSTAHANARDDEQLLTWYWDSDEASPSFKHYIHLSPTLIASVGTAAQQWFEQVSDTNTPLKTSDYTTRDMVDAIYSLAKQYSHMKCEDVTESVFANWTTKLRKDNRIKSLTEVPAKADKAYNDQLTKVNDLVAQDKEYLDTSSNPPTGKVARIDNAVTAANAEYEEAAYILQLATATFGDSGSTFPTGKLADLISQYYDSTHPQVDWKTVINTKLAESIANDSEVEWGDAIQTAWEQARDLRNVNWEELVTRSIVMQTEKYNKHYEEMMAAIVPEALKDGIELAREEIDELQFTDEDVYNAFGLLKENLTNSDYPRGREGVDYFRVIQPVEDSTGAVEYRHFFYTVLTTQDKCYSEPPLRITGGVPYAEEETIGGFLNVPDTQLGAGYVYRNPEGYLQLLDYDLLATGVLAYQLGENFVCPSGLASSEIQANLDEYINNRIAFPNANQYQYAEEQANANIIGALADASVIHVYLNVSSEESAYEINVQNIDSRFNTSVFLHISGDAGPECTINIVNCQRIRLDIQTTDNLKINLLNCCLYYDATVIDKLTIISNMSLWYDRFSADDPEILVDGMSVETLTSPEIVVTEDYWNLDSPNDNHYKYALKGVTISPDGEVVGLKLYVTDDITANIEIGKFISSFDFELPQSIGLPYPTSRLRHQLKVTGEFITAYPGVDSSGTTDGYYVKDSRFTALSYASTSNDRKLSGVISFLTDIQWIQQSYGFEHGTYIDSWESGKFHVFEGGIVD